MFDILLLHIALCYDFATTFTNRSLNRLTFIVINPAKRASSRDTLLELFLCPIKAIFEAALGDNIEFDLFEYIVEKLLKPSEAGDLSLSELVEIDEQCTAKEEVYSSVLGFVPVPFKQGWSSATLYDGTCIDSTGCNNNDIFCCDQVNDDTSRSNAADLPSFIERYECNGNDGTCKPFEPRDIDLSSDKIRCLGAGAKCGLDYNPNSIPCCHETDGNGGIWYVECEPESKCIIICRPFVYFISLLILVTLPRQHQH